MITHKNVLIANQNSFDKSSRILKNAHSMRTHKAMEAVTAEDFVTLLQRHRIARGLTQTALAGKLHVSPSAVSLWESGESVPSPSRIKKLARLLGVSALKLTELIEQVDGGAVTTK
jgi:ribosome-binding protein aMBF1 (putative translation factor)